MRPNVGWPGTHRKFLRLVKGVKKGTLSRKAVINGGYLNVVTRADHSSPAPRICVLLSTYNGAPYLAAQLDSLKAQQGVRVDLHVRDDGSSDATLAVLARYGDTWPNLAKVRSGPNLRPAASFLELLRTAPPGADFYAFCDQDDVWLPQKLARATQAIAAHKGPALYCSNVTCVAEDLSVIGVPRRNDDPRLQHLLFENIAYGCTTVINRAARDLVAPRLSDPASIIMHDWWIALAVAAFGSIHYDPEPQILYRQHGSNSLGAEVSAATQTLNQLRLLFRNRRTYWPIHAQAAEFLRQFGPDLVPADRRFVEELVVSKGSFLCRLRYALSNRIIRSRPIGGIAARGLVLAGWY
jgi:glycosyltransferase involved in cell wall biosynthesis